VEAERQVDVEPSRGKLLGAILYAFVAAKIIRIPKKIEITSVS